MSPLRAPSSRLIGLGRGRIYFNPQDPTTGLLKGFFPLGNAKKLSITTTPNTTQVVDYTQESSAPYAEFINQTALDIAIEMYEQSEDNVALATLGDRTTLTQTAGTITAETLVGATAVDIKGRVYWTLKRSISAVVVKQGATTLVAGTDYVVEDAVSGAIRLLETSATIVTGTAIVVDYTAAALTAGASDLAVVRGATQGGVKGSLRFIPGNTNGPKRELYIWICSLQPDGENNEIGDDVTTLTLKGSILSDAAGAYGGSVANPFYQKVNRVYGG
jgi:hypothetical protein